MPYADPEKRREMMRRYRAAHPEVARAYRQRNAEREAQRKREYWAANPDKKKLYSLRYREGNRERIRAIKREKLRVLRETQAGRPRSPVCELCDCEVTEIHWDHDHQTGKFRGWLCQTCNFILGNAGDDPVLLRKMADYAEKGGLYNGEVDSGTAS